MSESRSARQVANRRKRLLAASPVCFWCARKLVRHEDSWYRANLKGWPGKIPKNFPTFDHIYSRTAGRNSSLVVLACPSCNQTRNREEHQVAKHGGDVAVYVQIRYEQRLAELAKGP